MKTLFVAFILSMFQTAIDDGAPPPRTLRNVVQVTQLDIDYVQIISRGGVSGFIVDAVSPSLIVIGMDIGQTISTITVTLMHVPDVVSITYWSNGIKVIVTTDCKKLTDDECAIKHLIRVKRMMKDFPKVGPQHWIFTQ